LAKLVGLLVKTVAKPVSKRIKADFSRYAPTKHFLMSIGQLNHQFTSRMTIWSAGYRVRSITPLEDAKALTNGADFFGESVVFAVSGGVIVWEYARAREINRRKMEAARADGKAERARLVAKLRALDVRLKAVEEVARQNSESILRRSPKYVEPSAHELVPIVDEADDLELLSHQQLQQQPEQQQSSAPSMNETNETKDAKRRSLTTQVDGEDTASGNTSGNAKSEGQKGWSWRLF